MRAMMNSSRARPTPVVGQALEVEREFRIADVHRDLDRRLGHRLERQIDHLDFEHAAIDEAGIAFRARHGHRPRRPSACAVASPQPTTAGMPSSRAMIAA